ncbi:MAG: anti-sigma F factor antagonist [Epulopiscium sp. Nuni2H_MBin003]|nr:MAG: anti-sigma F factor antagonist [Epulopiscium sp. Nuni2H_MBin003]
MSIDTKVQNNILVVNLEGEIDHHTSTVIREEVDKIYNTSRLNHIIFNFEKVTFMDSSGVGLLIGRYRMVTMAGGKIGLVKVKSELDKVMNLSGVYKLMKRFEDESVAISHL